MSVNINSFKVIGTLKTQDEKASENFNANNRIKSESKIFIKIKKRIRRRKRRMKISNMILA